ncbi:hypothetical protein E2C01_071193 [Portunus trituberculatus]|uniref:Uncharacterized protein n=1 Tax=Portunus trituberculatus TaxID=210409 RepID=A0A5B7I7K9_PORTR|nr:hypothetical protein [Portunus trituberculatus]
MVIRVGDQKAVTAAIPYVLHHRGKTLASHGAVTDLPITLPTPPSPHLAAATATRRRGSASHWAFTAGPLTRAAVAATDGFRIAAAWQTPATSPLLTLRDFASQRPGKHLLHHHYRCRRRPVKDSSQTSCHSTPAATTTTSLWCCHCT